MMRDWKLRTIWTISIAVFVLGVPVTSQVPSCGAYEEGSSPAFTCSTSSNFDTMAMQIQENNDLLDLGNCDSLGNCVSVYPERFLMVFRSNASMKNVSVKIESVTRHMTLFRCFRNGVTSDGLRCIPNVYVKPSPPVCTGPEFVEGGASAHINCTSDRVYPSVLCAFKLMNGPVASIQNARVYKTYTDSDQFPGDREVKCVLEVPVAGRDAGEYHFQVVLIPDLAKIKKEAAVVGDSLPPLKLSATTLFYPEENDHVFSYPDQSQVSITIQVKGSPPPNRFSLSVRDSETSGVSPLSSGDYEVTYDGSTVGGGGVIHLIVKKGFDKNEDRYFTFRADNGIVGNPHFEYRFSVKKESSQDFLTDSSEVQNTNNNGDKDSNDNTIVIVGLAVGGAILITIAVVVAVLYLRKFNARRKNNNSNSSNNQCGDGNPGFRLEDNGYMFPVEDSGTSSGQVFTVDGCPPAPPSSKPPPYEIAPPRAANNGYDDYIDYVVTLPDFDTSE